MKNKFLRLIIMSLKLSCYIFIMQVVFMTSLIASNASAQYKSVKEVYITARFENTSVIDIFKYIEAKTDFKFHYFQKHIKKNAKLTFTGDEVTVAEVLYEVSDIADIKFLQLNNNIAVSVMKKPSENNLSVLEAVSIQGKITDEAGEELPGVSIIIKGTSKGTTSDIDGNYKLEAETGNTLSFSYIGYTTQDIVIGSQTVIDVVLSEDISTLSEVVVIGYQSQRAEEVTSAIGSVKSKEIAKVMVGNTSFDRSLVGLLKGVNVTSPDGTPGGNVNINIRGHTSPFSGSDSNPLWVIDGVSYMVNPIADREDRSVFAKPFNPLLSINPNDIERMDVLKDAAATSIYGSRGANGVIIVTTKRGKRNTKPTVSWSSSISVSKPIGQEEMLNTTEWKEHLDTYFKNTPTIAVAGPWDHFIHGTAHQNIRPLILRNPDGTYLGLNEDGFGKGTTDWYDVLANDHATTKTHNLAIRGGSEVTSYSVSMGYTDKQGLSLRDDLKQYNLKLTLDSKINKMFETGVNLNLSHSYSKSGSFESLNPGTVFSANLRPDIPFLDENGDPSLRSTTIRQRSGAPYSYSQGSAYANQVSSDIQTKAYNATGNTYLKVNVNENISVKAAVSSGVYVTDGFRYTPQSILGESFGFPFEMYSTNASVNSSRAGTRVLNTNVTTDLTANYSNAFGKHTVNGLIGYSWLRDRGDRTRTNQTGFPDDFILTNPSSAATTVSAGSVVESGLNSLIGRATYNYDSKYFATVSVRTDKSSKFGPGNKTGVFPAISASWNVAKEDFLNGSDFIDLLNLRVSHGTTGSTNVRDFTYVQGFQAGPRAQGLYNNVLAVGLKNQLANEDVAWEETKELNVGLDFGLLNNRIRGSIDVYDKQTEGALLQTPIPRESGLTSFESNFADLSNKGFEFELAGDILVKDDLKWSASFNIAQNKNKVLSVPENISENPSAFFVVGQPVGIIRGYKIEGIYQDQDQIDAGVPLASGSSQVGDYIIANINGDTLINFDDRDAILGTGQADYFGGFSSDLSYKGFTLSVLFNYSIGGEVVDSGYRPESIADVASFNVLKRNVGNNTWSEDNRDAKFPRIGGEGGNVGLIGGFTTVSTHVYDKTFIRLRNVQLAYNLPKNVISSVGLSQASVFVSASNLHTWFKEFPGIDAENGTSATTNGQGAGNNYVSGKAWSFGINLNF